jgi:hypothetical protein
VETGENRAKPERTYDKKTDIESAQKTNVFLREAAC